MSTGRILKLLEVKRAWKIESGLGIAGAALEPARKSTSLDDSVTVLR
jgi:hypothetical protein